jgi:hypothetical protein
MKSMFDAPLKLIMYILFHPARAGKKSLVKRNDELLLVMHNLSGRLAGMSCNPGYLSSQKQQQGVELCVSITI